MRRIVLKYAVVHRHLDLSDLEIWTVMNKQRDKIFSSLCCHSPLNSPSITRNDDIIPHKNYSYKLLVLYFLFKLDVCLSNFLSIKVGTIFDSPLVDLIERTILLSLLRLSWEGLDPPRPTGSSRTHYLRVSSLFYLFMDKLPPQGTK